MNMLPPPMVAVKILAGKGLSRGRCPVSRFSWMVKTVKLPRFLAHNGNLPDSRLFLSANLCRVEMPPSSDGISPVRLLSFRYSHVRLDRLPSSGGIDPVSPLFSSCRCMRLGRFPSSGGSVPFSL